MTTYHDLLVAHDFSPDSEAALEWAIGLASRTGARVHLLHVVRSPVELLSPYEVAAPAPMLEELRKAAAARLEPALARLKDAGVSAEVHVREGGAAKAIAAEAEALGADLIVMGTRGLSGLKHVLLGSVAERTLRAAPCPVVTVKAGAAD